MDADIVYPKSWAPFKAMEERTELYGNGDFDGIKHLEKKLLKQNADHKDWECTEEMMAKTKNGKALYLHCLPADITDVSCEAGEVAATVFDRYRDPLYKQAFLQAVHHRGDDLPRQDEGSGDHAQAAGKSAANSATSASKKRNDKTQARRKRRAC